MRTLIMPPGGVTFTALNSTPAKDATLYVIDESFGKDTAWVIRQAVFAAAESAYRSDSLKSKPAKAAMLKSVTFAMLGKPAATKSKPVSKKAPPIFRAQRTTNN